MFLRSLFVFLQLSLPVLAQVSGVVLDLATQQPIVGAVVTLQGTTQRTTTGSNGTYLLPINGTNVIVTAAAKGYYTEELLVTTPITGVAFALEKVAFGHDLNYQFLAPQNCGVCHPDQLQQWTGSPMARAGSNTWVYDLFDGTGSPGGLGGFVYQRDSVHSSVNPASECASCHQPEPWIKQPGRAMDPMGALSPGAMHGISCEVCHKVANVDVGKMNSPGIFPGAVEFNLPDPPVANHQVLYGALGDATFDLPGVMRPSYQPQLRAEVCGACHQDKNDPDDDGDFDEPNGVISEPTYFEWLASPYANAASGQFKSCVDCHMPATTATTICAAMPVPRDPTTIRSHRIEGTTPQFLENAAELRLQVANLGFGLMVTADVENKFTGHHLPTGVTVRNMILLVEAWDIATGQRLPQLAGETLSALAGANGSPDAGYYAGLPGRLYAKVNRSAAGTSPTFFSEATSIASDNRIPAGATDTTSYLFASGSTSGRIAVRGRLIYRRAWRALVDAKQWTTNGHGAPLEDIAAPYFGHLMEEVKWQTGAGPVATFGNGCGGLTIGTQGTPTSGASQFTITLAGAPPTSFALLSLGLSDTTWAGMALPLDLGLLGAPGCFLLVAPEAVHTTTTSGQGNAAIQFAIPHPAPVGLELFAQWATTANNALGLQFSNGLSFVLQR